MKEKSCQIKAEAIFFFHFVLPTIFLVCFKTLTTKAWDDSSMSGHSKMYTSGYRRVNRRRLRTQNEDFSDITDFTILGTPPPAGECIRLVNR